MAELADRHRRLDLLDADGDAWTAVRAVFSWSYQHLSPATARAFWLAGVHPGAEIDAYSLAALLGEAVTPAGELLEMLARAYLVQPVQPGRYQMHDLLRAYASTLAQANDGSEAQRAALTRLFDYYRHSAAAAMDALRPAERHRRPRIPVPAAPVPPVADAAAARAWLDAQRSNLVAIAAHTSACGWPAHAITLAATLYRYLDTGGHYPEAVAIHTYARNAARCLDDLGAEATALTSLSAIDRRRGRQFELAQVEFKAALSLACRIGDKEARARRGISRGGSGIPWPHEEAVTRAEARQESKPVQG